MNYSTQTIPTGWITPTWQVILPPLQQLPFTKFMWIPWDLDSSFGVDWGMMDMETADIYAFEPRDTQWGYGNRPLIDRIMQVPAFADYYRKCHKYYIENFFNEDHLYPRIDELKALILDAVLEDEYQSAIYENLLLHFFFPINSTK